MITNFEIFESEKVDNLYKIITKNLDMDEDDFILFKLKRKLHFHGWLYSDGDLYIGHLYNIQIRPELHFEVATDVDDFLSRLKRYSPIDAYDNSHRNTLTNMQFKLMFRQMDILKKGTINDMIEKLEEINTIEKYGL